MNLVNIIITSVIVNTSAFANTSVNACRNIFKFKEGKEFIQVNEHEVSLFSDSVNVQNAIDCVNSGNSEMIVIKDKDFSKMDEIIFKELLKENEKQNKYGKPGGRTAGFTN